MKLIELKNSLSQHPDKTLRFVLPTGSKVPPHVHVTEVANVQKRFVDCGGTLRTESTCQLQAWGADDTEHRLTAGKLHTILDKGKKLFESDEVDVAVEYEAPFISQFPIKTAEPEGEALLLVLGTRHTACLAEDKCLAPAPKSLAFKPLPTLQPASCCR